MLSFCTQTGDVFAQSTVCSDFNCHHSKHDFTPASVMISNPHSKQEWMLSYKYMNMRMQDLISGTHKVTNKDVSANYHMLPDNMRMDMHMLMGMYGVSNRLTLMGMLNYNVIKMNMSISTASSHRHTLGSDTTMTTHFMQTAGLGDFIGSIIYNLMKLPNDQLLLSAGLSLPLGSISVKGASTDAMYPNRNYPYSMQLGSGTFDVLPCVNYLHEKAKWTSSIQMAGIIRIGYNSMGYKLGNEIILNTWFAYQWHSLLSSSVRLQGSWVDKIKGYDSTLYASNEPAAKVDNYGGKKINVALGSVIQFKKGFLRGHRLAIESMLPIYQNFNGIQMKLNDVLVASWSVGF
jgi:hypothetical protein